MVPESELVRRCLSGEPEAWDALFDAHYAAAARFLFRLGPRLTAGEVEEIAQETFLAVIRNLGEFRGSSGVQTWIFRIAANKARDWIERRDAAKRGGGLEPISLSGDPEGEKPPPDPPSRDRGPDEEAEVREEAALLRAGLDAMGDPCREMLELRYFAELSYEEIAAATGLNPKTVSSRLSRCLGRLGEILRRQPGVFSV